MKEFIKIGAAKLTAAEAIRLYTENKYIITYGAIFQLFYSAAQRQTYGAEIYRGQNLTRRGSYRAATAEEVNELLQFELLRTD